MAQSNRMSRMVARINRLPGPLRPAALSAVFGRMVPFVGTAGLRIERMDPERVVVRLRNRRRVQNHIRTLHAAAVTLLAETASGFVFGQNLPDDKLPLMKSLQVDFLKRNRGGLRVTASLGELQRRQLRDEPKGSVAVPVEAVDDAGQATVACSMVWAWVPKRHQG